MTEDQKIDEQAIRAQLDAAMNKMEVAPEPSLETPGESEGAAAPNPAAPKAGRRGGKRSGGGGGEAQVHVHKGTIVSVDGPEAMVELGPRTQGVISVEEFDEPPEVGAEFEFSLVSIKDGLWTLSRKEARTLATWKNLEKGRSVKATVIGENSGGLEMKVGPVSAFMPASEVDTKRVEDFASYVGQTFVCEVIEVVRKRKRVVLSRKGILYRERREARDRTLESMTPGQVVSGKVEKIEGFGAFIDLGGGLSGLLHVSNISHKRTDDPSTVLTVGESVEVQILEIKNGGKRIGLGMKQLQADPWEAVKEKFRQGQVTKGKVIRIADFGAFVEITDAVEGLLHKSQLSPDRVNRVEDAVSVGAEVTVRIQSIDLEAKRISLSCLTDRGTMIGAEDDVGSEVVDKYMSRGKDAGAGGQNLGNILRAAMEQAQKKD